MLEIAIVEDIDGARMHRGIGGKPLDLLDGLEKARISAKLILESRYRFEIEFLIALKAFLECIDMAAIHRDSHRKRLSVIVIDSKAASGRKNSGLKRFGLECDAIQDIIFAVIFAERIHNLIFLYRI